MEELSQRNANLHHVMEAVVPDGDCCSPDPKDSPRSWDSDVEGVLWRLESVVGGVLRPFPVSVGSALGRRVR